MVSKNYGGQFTMEIFAEAVTPKEAWRIKWMEEASAGTL
jgi:hypothetical protein